MNRFDVQLEFYLSALERLISHHDSPSIQMDYAHKEMAFRYAVREYAQELEQRITENVLKVISIKFESGDALNEIKALKNAIDNLGK